MAVAINKMTVNAAKEEAVSISSKEPYAFYKQGASLYLVVRAYGDLKEGVDLHRRVCVCES